MKNIFQLHKNLLYLTAVLFFFSCTKEVEVKSNEPPPLDTTPVFQATPYDLTKLRPIGWSLPPIPEDNPLTEEGVALGRKIFYDPILSANNQMSCASCHALNYALTDNGKRYSMGIDGSVGTRNAMPLFNLAWVERFAPTVNGRPLRFFWDGGASSLEAQALDPIVNPIEMKETLPNVLTKLRNHPEYPALFKKAFGTDSITTKRLAQAIAQFERTIVSSNAKIDRYIINPANGRSRDTSVFTPEEMRGFNVFNNEDKGDCFHCHNVNSPYSSDFQFHHNGHSSNDEGLMRITGKAEDKGKFRTPSLRNLVFTAPYMHDGRFNTLEEVVEFYNSGIVRQYPTDPLLLKHAGGLGLSSQEKSDLVAFLKTMTDSTLINNPLYAKP